MPRQIGRRDFVKLAGGTGLTVSVGALGLCGCTGPPPPCPQWENIGPDNVPGRVYALAIHPSDGNRVFAASAVGGIFKTTNAGKYWNAKWGRQLSLAMGGLAVAPSDPNTIYASTGQWSSLLGGAIFPGAFVYRSVDAGERWTLLASITSRDTAAVAIHPTDPNQVFVAGDASLHRTRDGGIHWDVTPGNVNGVFDGAVSDVVVDPNDGARIYIGVHKDGVFRSDNGGDSWTRLTGLPTGDAAVFPKLAVGRRGRSSTQFVAVMIKGSVGSPGDRVYTSTDGGNTPFTQTPTLPIPGSYTLVPYPRSGVLAVDPDDESVLFAGAGRLFRTPDGGATWPDVTGTVHVDMWSIAFDPLDSQHLYLATDGGIYESTNNGNRWTLKSTGLVNTQCWTVAVSQAGPLAYGFSGHDIGAWQWGGSGRSFTPVSGVEGGWIEFNPSDARTIYVDGWGGGFPDSVLRKSQDGGITWTRLGIDTANFDPTGAGHSREALSIARTNPNLLLAIKTTGAVAQSSDGGGAWTETLTVSGVIISAVQFTPSDNSTAYAASTDGRVWFSVDGGASWTELSHAGLPAGRIHDIEVDGSDPFRVYLAFGTPSVRPLWRGEVDAAHNVTWFDVSGAFPAVSLPTLAVTGLALDPVRQGTIYCSNTRGVYRTIDGGASWAPFDEGLPNSLVTDLDIQSKRITPGTPVPVLYAATWGRGLYRRSLA